MNVKADQPMPCPKCGVNPGMIHSPNCPYAVVGGGKPVEPPDPYAKVPALAKRLGVEPFDPKTTSGRTFFQMRDGMGYDVFDLVNAVLDRIEKKVK